MMKKTCFGFTFILTRISFILVFTAFQLFAVAQNQENAILWKISRDGLDKPSYLFGTIHMFCPDDMIFNEALKSTFSRVEQLVMEIDMSDPEIMQKTMTMMMNPDKANIQEQLSEEEKDVVNDFFKKHYGAGLDQLGVFKPFALYSMVSIKLFPCPHPISYENMLTEWAKANEISIIGLETLEYQMNLMDEFSDVMLKEMVRSVKELSKEKELIEKLISAYKEQDLQRINKLMEEYDQFMNVMNKLLDNRNEAWVPKIEKVIKQKPAFIAVGAGHLGSENGLINLLQKQGYKVDPIKL